MAKKKSDKGIKPALVIDKNKEVEKQFFWLVGIIIALIVGFVFVPVLYHQIFEKFEYAGVKFEKIKNGELTFFYGQFPIIYKGELVAIYNTYLRHDPRKNDIPVNATIKLSKTVSVSLGENLTSCEDAVLGQALIGQFVSAFPFVKNVTAGFKNESFAKELGFPYISCESASSENSVLVVQKSKNPSIEMGEKDNCFVLNVGECEYMETVERFVVAAMAQINEKPLE